MSSSIQWGVVAAFVVPLLAGLGLLGTFLGWLQKRRNQITQAQITMITDLLDMRLQNVETGLVKQSEQMTEFSKAMLSVSTQIARIEGRLMGTAKDGV